MREQAEVVNTSNQGVLEQYLVAHWLHHRVGGMTLIATRSGITEPRSENRQRICVVVIGGFLVRLYTQVAGILWVS